MVTRQVAGIEKKTLRIYLHMKNLYVRFYGWGTRYTKYKYIFILSVCSFSFYPFCSNFKEGPNERRALLCTLSSSLCPCVCLYMKWQCTQSPSDRPLLPAVVTCHHYVQLRQTWGLQLLLGSECKSSVMTETLAHGFVAEGFEAVKELFERNLQAGRVRLNTVSEEFYVICL